MARRANTSNFLKANTWSVRGPNCNARNRRTFNGNPSIPSQTPKVDESYNGDKSLWEGGLTEACYGILCPCKLVFCIPKEVEVLGANIQEISHKEPFLFPSLV